MASTRPNRSFHGLWPIKVPWMASWISDQNGIESSAIGTSSHPKAASAGSIQSGRTTSWRTRPASVATTTHEVTRPDPPSWVARQTDEWTNAIIACSLFRIC